MEPISNVDRLTMLLRQKLVERSQKGSAARKADRTPAQAVVPADPTGLKALSASGDVDDHALRRAVVQSVLADHLGSELINTAEFQNVVSQVTKVIEQEPAGLRLVTAVIDDLRSS